jgi:uncharacterized protein YcnI
LAALTGAGAASAHVHVDDGQQPAQGGYGIVRLVVPTESAGAATVGLTVTLPDDVDLTSARTLPLAGWTAAVETEPSGAGERVSRIMWRAIDPANGVKPSEFGEFTVSAGPWPADVDAVPLLTDQAYSDGSVVAWNEIAVDKDTEPEHPAPVVTLGATEEGHSHGDGHGAPAEATAELSADVTQTAATASTDESWWWRATSVVSLLIAVGTAAALVLVLRRTRNAGS